MFGLAKRLLQPGRYLLLSLYVMFFLFRFALALLDVPKVRLIERAVCEQYYRKHPPTGDALLKGIPENQCKLLPIQVEVATVTGWRLSLDAVPGSPLLFNRVQADTFLWQLNAYI
jgi:hypothetical protein